MMKKYGFSTGAFAVFPDGGLNAAQKLHSVPGELYDDDVLSWLISNDDKEMFSDGYVSNKGDCITIHIRPELNKEKTINTVKDIFLHEQDEIGLSVKIAKFRGWDIECFVAGINKGPFRVLKDADLIQCDSEFVEINNHGKNIFRCAIDQAWIDMCRTLKSNKAKAKKWETFKEYMAADLKDYFNSKPKKSESAFDGWHGATTFNFREKGGLTVGQSQKILNMAMKYLYCCQDYRIGKKEHFRYCHMPLDGFILNWYKGFVDKDYDGEPWSKIDDLVKYSHIKNEIRQTLGAENVLEKEFEIWHTEKEKAEKKELRSCANRIMSNPNCSVELKELLEEFCGDLQG